MLGKKKDRGKPKELFMQYKKNKELFYLFIPVLLYYVIFCYIPMGEL